MIAGMKLAFWLAVAVPGILAIDAVAFAQSAHAQVVRDIRVEGNRRLEPETVRSYLKFSVGDQYSSGAANGSLRALLRPDCSLMCGSTGKVRSLS